MADRNSFGKVFKISGFKPEEIHDIECRTKEIKQIEREQKLQRRAIKSILNYRKFSFMTINPERKKTKAQKVSEQIQYGYDIVAWWGLQHA